MCFYRDRERKPFCKSLIRGPVHGDKVVLANFFDAVLVNVQRCLCLRPVQFVYLSFLLKDILSLFFVFNFAHVQGQGDVFTHLLLLEVVLPLLNLELFLANLVQVLHNLLLLAQRRILLVHLLFDLVLANFHVFQLDLTGNQRHPLPALHVPFAKVEQAVRVTSLKPSSVECQIGLG